MHFTARTVLLLALALFAGCAAPRKEPDAKGHLSATQPASGTIPEVVTPPVMTPPTPEPRTEVYTVTVKEVPVKELLFALARDAELNLDLHPDVSGTITLNAIDQPLPQILHRIGRQANLRYELEPPNLVVTPDTPFLRSYKIDYVNMVRKTTASVSVATEIATTGVGATASRAGSTGSNNSVTRLEQTSSNEFWETLVANVGGVLGEARSGSILVNRESGVLTLRATQRQHEEVQHLIDQVVTRAQQQVLIEATLVEVELSDRFQSGVDWSVVDSENGVSLNQQVTGANLAVPPVTTLIINKPNASNLLATIKLLEQFGDLKVLSSPKVMALNNQTALLKVVDNRVYFTIDVDIQAATNLSPTITTFESNVHSVPVGFIMAVTPQIADTDLVTLNVRPTISRILGFVRDPNPALADAGVISEIPEIQVREIESVLKVSSGQTAVLGGLMQDTVDNNRTGVPLLSSLPIIGNLFSYRDDRVRKTELIIFLRPSVIRNASVDGDLRSFRAYLPPEGGKGEVQ